MARRRKNSGSGLLLLVECFFGGVAYFATIVTSYIDKNSRQLANLLIALGVILVAYIVIKNLIKKIREDLTRDIVAYLDLENVKDIYGVYDDEIIVKSRQTLSNYNDIKYLKERNNIEDIKSVVSFRNGLYEKIEDFLEDNEFKVRLQYSYVEKQIASWLQNVDGYNVLVKYITPAGNINAHRTINITKERIQDIEKHPEWLMNTSEYNKYMLDNRKTDIYNSLNKVTTTGNEIKERLITVEDREKMDELIQSLLNKIIAGVPKIKQASAPEWEIYEVWIMDAIKEIKKIIEENNKLFNYYQSDDFKLLQNTCQSLNSSRKEFNDYIKEKAKNISGLFGTKVVRNETINEDIYNYVRPYKKTISPFTAEVSSSVFSSAENNPIEYIIKYFYPDKSQYKEQIQKLRVLIEELETLKEAKEIINAYKADYDKYIKSVPRYVLEKDEDGFYSRLGLAKIDEAILNVEYRFVYTSEGGMAQRSFSVPMTEENIIELINRLESRLTYQALSKEQRALMTTKFRAYIKKRDNFTCCNCHNSIYKELNLLLEVDHIVPIAKGGLTREDNLQTLCWRCNRAKGAKIV